MFKLILKFQDTVVEEYEFHTTPVTVGRRDDNNIVIDNMAVSGHHAVIEEEDPNYYVLVDLESLNGTFVNETKVTRQRIFDGDSLIVGKHTLVFVDLRPEDERPVKEDSVPDGQVEGQKFRDTVILDTKAQQELLARHAEERGISPEEMAAKPKKVNLFGSITIMSGGYS